MCSNISERIRWWLLRWRLGELIRLGLLWECAKGIVHWLLRWIRHEWIWCLTWHRGKRILALGHLCLHHHVRLILGLRLCLHHVHHFHIYRLLHVAHRVWHESSLCWLSLGSRYLWRYIGPWHVAKWISRHRCWLVWHTECICCSWLLGRSRTNLVELEHIYLSGGH